MVNHFLQFVEMVFNVNAILNTKVITIRPPRGKRKFGTPTHMDQEENERGWASGQMFSTSIDAELPLPRVSNKTRRQTLPRKQIRSGPSLCIVALFQVVGR